MQRVVGVALLWLISCTAMRPEPLGRGGQQAPRGAVTGGADGQGDTWDGGQRSGGKPQAGPGNGEAPGSEPLEPEPRAAEHFRVASFNIRVFGASKRKKPDVMAVLVRTIRQYDLVGIQEIKDSSLETPGVLLEAINAVEGPRYGMRVSPRTGSQPSDSRSQEQYAFYYREGRIRALSDGEVFDDSAHDHFQREPFAVRFAIGTREVVFINIHTRPEAALAEIAALTDVVQWARQRYPDQQGIVIGGDFNAGCQYASPAELAPLEIRSGEYVWAIPDHADSSLAKARCAYDRIVLDEQAAETFLGRWGVDQGFDDPDVSDHWPVWAELAVELAPEAQRQVTPGQVEGTRAAWQSPAAPAH